MTKDELNEMGYTIKSGAKIFDNRNGFDEILLLFNKHAGVNQPAFICHGRQGIFTKPVLMHRQLLAAQMGEK